MTESNKSSTGSMEDKELDTFRKSITPNTGRTSILTIVIVGGTILAFVAFFYSITHQYEDGLTAPASTAP